MSKVKIYFGCDAGSNLFDKRNYRRSVPTQTQVRTQLGSRLSEVFFENLSCEARHWLGLTPPLKGPDKVWVDPSARLQNKVTLTPVPEPASLYLKALTHAAILEIGGNYEAELLNRHNLEMEVALRNQAYRFEEEAKDRAKMMGWNKNTDEEKFEEHKKIVGTLMEHFEKCFDELVEITTTRMRKECQSRIMEEREEIASHMLRHVQDEVIKRDNELCNDFHDILYSELNVLAERYINQINKEREIAVKILQDLVYNYEKKIKEVKAEMEMFSTIDICQAIARERIECNEKIKKVRGEAGINYGPTMEDMQRLKAQNTTLQKMSTERLKRLMEWRKKVKMILEEFQRFINFALKAAPGQAEYLLSMKKLMLQKFPEDTFLSPEDYSQYQKCIKEKKSALEEVPRYENLTPKISESSEKTDDQLNEDLCSDLSKECIRCYQSFYSGGEEKSNSNLNFDFDTFKSKLIKRYMPSICRDNSKKIKRSNSAINKKKQTVVGSVDKTNEFYQTLIMVGENEKEHEVPIDTFLEKRLKTVLKICKDDPEFAKIMLGCSDQ